MKRILHLLTTVCVLIIWLPKAAAQLQVSFIPEISLIGNNEEIRDGDTLPSMKDNTHFGNVGLTHTETKEFIIENTGPASLVVSDINFTMENADEFALIEVPAFPITLESNKQFSFQVVFTPKSGGTRLALLSIVNNDIDESVYNVLLQGEATFTTGIKANESVSVLKLYPNPSANLTTLEIISEEQQPFVMHLFNLQGQEIKLPIERIFSKGHQRFDLITSDLDDGFYYVTIVSDRCKESIKLAVLH